ncbi:MAG: hypothetical protein CL547_14880 [Alcanivorax sp.]|nr:hypothetical protein [Alcanivorax sp.]|tara:strand:- start:469 stop:1434 length:966 start_codon:yes stop_codon:yes gene_type:complete
MLPEIRLIHQLSQNSIFEVASRTEADLKAWLASGGYLIDRPLASAASGRADKFELRFQNPDFLFASLANDCNRFSQAAIETMWSVKKVEELPKSTGWASIQMYYSAFFAVHAILRIFGRACTQLDKSHVDVVYQLACATQMDGGVSGVENGFYISKIENGYIEYIKLKESHADTWFCFSDLLNWIIDELPNTSGIGRHKYSAIDLVSNLKLSLRKSGAGKGNWPSMIRNKINYQHSHGVWYPYKGAVHDPDAVLKNSEWLKFPDAFDINGSKSDVQMLFNISNSILSFMYSLMRYGYDRAGGISKPLANGTFRLVNQIKVA